MRLVVSEKPSMGRAIAAAVGLKGSGRHAIVGRDLIVTWCVGHLVQAVDPEGYDPALKAWRLQGLPLLPEAFRYAPNPSTLDQWQAVRELLQRDDLVDVVNATDAGREGQLIFHLAYDLAGCKRPVQRLWTSSLTDDAIRTAWAAMKPDSAYRGLTDAARCRQEADWLVGINCTRAQTLVAQSQGGQGVYSVGRVQTPTLAILVQRQQEIDGFVAKDFWTVIATLQPDVAPPGPGATTYKGRWFRPAPGKQGAAVTPAPGDAKAEPAENEREIERFDNEADARALADRLRGQPGVVHSVQGRNERRKPELLYDLTALQKEANRRFKWSAEHTLQVAQQLYEAKLLSYPRTGARHLTQDDAKKAPQWLMSLDRGPFAGFVAEVRAMGKGAPPPLGKRFVDDTQVEDHSALVVTEKAPPIDAGGALALPPDQARLYDLVARRLLAAWFPDRVEAKTTVVTGVLPLGAKPPESELFRTTGAVLKDAGWTRVDPPPQRERKDDDDDPGLPPLKKGEKVTAVAVQPKAGKTSPPRPMNEADLLGAMQGAGRELDDDELRGAMKDAGLGTPATRANIIETLVKRSYVERQKNNLRPTDKGMAVIDSIEVEALKSPLMTGQWEAAMERIRRGTAQRADFMREIRHFVAEQVARITSGRVRVTGNVASGPGAVLGACPRCGSNLLHKTWQGRDLARCSAIADPKCRVSYEIDATGTATRRCPACTGALSERGGCVVCGRGAEIEPGRPPPPPVVKCEQCRKVTRLVWSQRTAQWCLRCDPCGAWLQATDPKDLPPLPAVAPCPACARDLAPMWSPRKQRWYLSCEPCGKSAWA